MGMGVEGKTPSVRTAIAEMQEYVPVRTSESLAQKLGLRLDQIMKLDANENPYGCSPKVLRALGRYSSYHRYPDPQQEETRSLLAEYVGVPADYLLLGMGADELIDYVLRLYVETGDEVIELPPTFGMYSFSTHVCGGKLVPVPRGERFEIDLEGVERAITERTKVIFVDSPNNPSGGMPSMEDVERLLATGRVVVLDEAYSEFSNLTFAPLVQRYPNLVVLRTFSKWAGLAGLRVGYGVFPLPMLRQLWKMKQPYNLNVAAEVAVHESLLDSKRLLAKVKRIIRERGRLLGMLESLDFLRVYPSQGNYILCDVLEGNAMELMQFMAHRGIILRYFKKPRLMNSIRISVGLPEHTDAVVAGLREWRASQG